MSERIHALAQRLFGKATIEECNLEEVKNLAQRFPYFAPAQFLLLEKLKQEGAEEYSSQVQKSILYYHNPLEFQYFISSDRFYTETSFAEDEVSFEEKTVEEEKETAGEEEARIEEPGTSAETETVMTEPEIIETQPADNGYEEPLNEDAVSLPQQLETLPEEQPFQAEESQPQKPGAVSSSIEGFLQTNQTANFKLPISNSEITFEPFHTVDYFASQGIKLSQEEIPKDKFGKQLKSFTEWLKTMKRLPPTQMTSPVDSGSENKVQHLADDSVHESSVWTEAMAEVWIKQGNTQKAIETYNKLVLLNPSKKAYFATKIENLKRP